MIFFFVIYFALNHPSEMINEVLHTSQDCFIKIMEVTSKMGEGIPLENQPSVNWQNFLIPGSVLGNIWT